MTQRLAIPSGGNAESENEVRALREQCGLSQEQLASALGYSRKQVVRWETGASVPRRMVREALIKLRAAKAERPTANPAQPQFRFIDLFAGIGGLRRAFEPAGGKCVFTAEWDSHCQKTYRANYRTDHPLAGDIVAVPSEAIPPHDLLLAGFPCQPFSLAGISKKNSLGRPHGFDCNTQGTLFFEIERILRFHRPRAFLLENVKHLLRHDGGRTWSVMMEVLRKRLAYDVHYRVIDARCVLPQHRERVYLVGFAEPTAFSWEAVDLPESSTGPRMSAVLHPEDGSEPVEEAYTDSDGNVRSKYVLSAHLWNYLRQYAEKHRAKGNGFGYTLIGPEDVARTLSARYHKDGSEILIRRGRARPRRLTPRECARLMGFDPLIGSPAAQTPTFEIPVSDTQAYRQFGNSVAVPVVGAIARAMAPFLTGNSAVSSIRTQLELQLA